LVYAYDVSDRYIQIAKKKNSHLQNVVFRSNDGLSFPEIADESIDFCFSGWTMRHMPTKEVVIKNIEDMSRVLKNGGLYKIDPPIGTARGRIISKMVNFVLPLLDRHNYKLKLTPTYRGTLFTEKEISTILLNCNLSVNSVTEDDGFKSFSGRESTNKWFYGKKEKNTD